MNRGGGAARPRAAGRPGAQRRGEVVGIERNDHANANQRVTPMAYQLSRLACASSDAPLSPGKLESALRRLRNVDRPRYARLWSYFRNPMRLCGGDADRPYRQAQEWGLPPRITGRRTADGAYGRKEVVIENDIAWRIDAMVDYLFGKALVLRSAAPDAERRRTIDHLVRAIIAHNGGILFLQQLALLGAVHGFVDVLVKLDRDNDTAPADGSANCALHVGRPPIECAAGAQGGTPPRPQVSSDRQDAGPAPQDHTPPDGDDAGPVADSGDSSTTDPGASTPSHDGAIERLARMIRLEIVEPARALPILSDADYRVVDVYGQAYSMPRPPAVARRRTAGKSGWLERLLKPFLPNDDLRLTDDEEHATILDLISPTRWQRYEDETLVAEGANALGRIPLVHIQNTAAPFEYAGASDVEPLLPLQDELNIRLSDRANRITLQSFKMYLGRGIENFTELPVGPGRMWSAEDPEAQVQEFGGDDNCPSEIAHIADVREAMDKTSGVSPIAAGAIKNRIGRLTSAAALRLTLISLLAKTDKKRTTYGAGLARIVELSLAWLDVAGLFKTTEAERAVDIHWPSPLPENVLEKLQEAEIKTRLGVPKETVLKELGY